jgi:hypothetical protein
MAFSKKLFKKVQNDKKVSSDSQTEAEELMDDDLAGVSGGTGVNVGVGDIQIGYTPGDHDKHRPGDTGEVTGDIVF